MRIRIKDFQDKHDPVNPSDIPEPDSENCSSDSKAVFSFRIEPLPNFSLHIMLKVIPFP